MLHFYGGSGLTDPITDDKGLSGISIFSLVKFDSTLYGIGDINDISLFVGNADTNYKYNSPKISIVCGDGLILDTYFRMIDNRYVIGSVPTDAEWVTYGIAGNQVMTIGNIDVLGGTTSERKIWLRCSLPAGISTANFTGEKLVITAEEEEL